jgi:hypothetical protein
MPSGLTTPSGAAPPSFARVQRAAAISGWAGTTLPFDVVTVDAAGLWDAANHQYVAKRAGWYAVSAYANGSSSEGGVWLAAGSALTMSVEAVVFGAGDNIQAVTYAHADVTTGIWIVPPLHGHTELGIGDAIVIQGHAGMTVPPGFIFAIYGPLA